MFRAPNGGEINGVYDKVPCAVQIAWNDRPKDANDFEFDGESKMWWDGSETQTIAGETLFTDEDGSDWMSHHLIPEDAEALTQETIDAFENEEKVGVLLDALEAAQKASDNAGLSMMLTHRAIENTKAIYQQLRCRSMELKERDLAAQTVEA